MSPRKKLLLVLVVSVLILVSGVVASNSVQLGICNLYDTCTDNLVFAYGRPVVGLFLIIVPFLLVLCFFSKKTIQYWLPRILWTLPIPIILTFATDIQCGGFLGCIPTRDWVAEKSAILYVALFALLILIRGIALWRKAKKVVPAKTT